MKTRILSTLLTASLLGTTIGIISKPAFAMDDKLVAKLEQNMHGAHRSDKNKQRNQYRRPLGTLAFFGLEPGMSVLEIAPGGGWYSEILAPSMRGSGTYIAGSYDPKVKDQPKYRYRQHQALLDNIKNKADLYGEVKVATYSPPESRNLWQTDAVDMVLTFRSSHGWTRTSMLDDVYSDFFKVVKPGGILGVVQHRAPEGGDEIEWAKKGYVAESRIVQAAEKAGFVLEASSDLNANSKDDKNHPEGVWTLPPTLALGDKDREKYVAIGESDRMTLRFRKPLK